MGFSEIDWSEAFEPVRTCEVCGCTDADCRQCIAKTGESCTWVPGKDLCSACEELQDTPAAELQRAKRWWGNLLHSNVRELEEKYEWMPGCSIDTYVLGVYQAEQQLNNNH